MPHWKSTKTRKAAIKRFKISATGKVMRRGAGKRHLNTHKSSKQKRRLHASRPVDKTIAHHVTDVLPFNHRG
jgi:large subunit ribosomal protein L35